MLHIEELFYDVGSVRVHPERERWSVSLRAIVVVCSQDLFDFLRWWVFHDDGTIVAQETRRIVVDVADNDG